jgi:hypothetical protein
MDEEKELPSKFSSLRVLSAAEVKSGAKAAGTTLEPVMTNRGLDLTTINILLATMKSAILLTSAEVPDLYLYQPLTHSTATLASFTPNAKIAMPNSRLAQALSSAARSTSAGRKDDDLHTSNYVENPLAWFHCLDKFEQPMELSILEKAFESSVEHSDPSPLYVITQLVPHVILGSTHVVDKATMKAVVSRVWLTPKAIKGRMQSQQRENSKLLRLIQLQSMLRLQLLAMDKSAFLGLYSKKLLDRKKRKEGKKATITDLIAEACLILEDASFLLEPAKPFPLFLAETISPSIYCSIPETVHELLDAFECPNPFMDDEQPLTEEIISPSTVDAVREVPRITSKKGKSESNHAKSVKFEHKDLTLESINLVAKPRSRNPLLKDAKATYVASHFNTKLANISAHYHEVQHQAMASKKTLRQNTSTSKIPSPRRSPRSSKHPKPSQRSATSVLDVPGLIVSETPSKGFRAAEAKAPSRTFDMLSIIGQPQDDVRQTLFDERAIVGETPVKPDKENVRVVPFQIPASRKPFAIARVNQGSIESTATGMPSNNARLMAQRALAAARGKR